MIARWLLTFALVYVALPAVGQTREEKVREDRRRVTEEGFWIYNNLPQAFQTARETGKPILVVLRCIPCEECVKLDDELVDTDPVLKPLLEQFVCARQVSTNGLDLSLFQYDTDQSFAAFMLNADGTIYGRFGTRSHRTEWLTDVSLQGLAEALKGALALHQNYPANRSFLAGKRGGKPEFASPEKFPTLAGKYTDALNYEGNVVQSCIHCNQIGEAQRAQYWTSTGTIPEKVLFPYPHPKSLGLILDPDHRARVKEVRDGSVAASAGLQAGDDIFLIGGQPPLSMADVQWVLHQMDADGGNIPIVVERDGNRVNLTMKLETGWRRADDITWRVSTWSLRRMVNGGMVLEAIDDEQRRELGIPTGKTALRAQHVGQYGEHAAAKRAGLVKGDIVTAMGGRDDLGSEQDWIRYAINTFKTGDQIELTYLRDGVQRTAKIPIQN